MMRLIPMTSSQIVSVGYDADVDTLVVQFSNGDFYQYDNVPPSAVVGLVFDPDSQGKAFDRNIRSQPFPYRKLAPEETRDFIV